MQAIIEGTDASAETAVTSSLRERAKKLTLRCQVLSVVADASIADHVGAVLAFVLHQSLMIRIRFEFCDCLLPSVQTIANFGAGTAATVMSQSTRQFVIDHQ